MTRDQLIVPTKGKPFHTFEVHTTSGEVYAEFVRPLKPGKRASKL